MAAAAANPFGKLLDFSAPVDVEAVESTVNIFYGAGAQDQVRGVPSPHERQRVICSRGCCCVVDWLAMITGCRATGTITALMIASMCSDAAG